MDLKLFFGTFVLIFLAELGDKTQLAAMAASAGTKSPFSIFMGAASALVLSALIAVLFGSTIQRYIPPFYLKVGAATLFILFGILLYVNAFKEKEQSPAPKGVGVGISGKVVIEAAKAFEQSTIEQYQNLSRDADSDHLRSLFEHLAQEEKQHINHLNQLIDGAHGEEEQEKRATPPEVPVLKLSYDDREVLDKAILHEQHTEQFYSSLAKKALLPDIKRAFALLAEEELTHIEHLEHFKETGKFISHI